MLCYRCGTHNPDGTEACSHCAQPLGPSTKAVSGPPLRRKSPPPDDIPYRVGQVLSDRYALLDFIGNGPVGWVYRAEDKDVGGEVALKLIRPKLLQTEDDRAHFLKAIRSGRQFSNPQLARVYEEGEHEGHVYFTAPHLGGRSLRSVLALKAQAKQAFPVREGLPLLAQIASAMTAAHAVGAHGDVKPENIFLLPDALKLTDFGIAQGIGRDPFVQAQKAFRGDVYLAPEYIAGTEVDARADVYALGVLMGEILAGVVPDGNIPSLRNANAELPLAVNGLYRRALNESRDARPATPADLIAELTQLVAASEKPTFDAPPAPPADALVEHEYREPPPVPPALRSELDAEEDGRQNTELVSPEDLKDELAKRSEGAPHRGQQGPPPWPEPGIPTLERPLSPPYRPREGRSDSRENRRRVRRSASLAVLLWIALAGLGLGAAGGWLILERLRNRTAPPPREETTGTGGLTEEPARRALVRAPPRGNPPPPEAEDDAPTDVEDDAEEEPVAARIAPPSGPASGVAAPEAEDDADAALEKAFRDVAPAEKPSSPADEGQAVAPPDSEVDNLDALVSYLEGTKAEADARVSGASKQ